MRKAFRWAAVGVGAFAAVLFVSAAGVYGATEYRLRKTYDVADGTIAASSDPAVIARGRHIYTTRSCNDCHGDDLAGVTFIDDPAAGRLTGSNLTTGRGGVLGGYSDAALARAIRHGLDASGRALIFMPSHEFYPLSDADVTALVSYIRSSRPVDREPPRQRIGPLARVLYLTGQMDLFPAELIDHSAARPSAPPEGRTVEYGGYLATGCIGCHGPGYSGGKIPGTPPSFPIVTNITPDAETGIGTWTEEDFFRAMREGTRPDGSELDPFMPWKNLSELSDDELGAMWLYLRSLPPRPAGGR